MTEQEIDALIFRYYVADRQLTPTELREMIREAIASKGKVVSFEAGIKGVGQTLLGKKK